MNIARERLFSDLVKVVHDLRTGSRVYPPPSLSINEWLEILGVIEEGLRAGQRLQDEIDPVAREGLTDSFDDAWRLMGDWFFYLWN